MYRSFTLAILLLTSICCQPSVIVSEPGLYPVTRIVDGDTFWLDDGTAKGLKVRLIGIDAPESRKTGKKDIGYFGKESGNYLEEMLSGKKVRLEYDVQKFDQYHRVLAYVYLEDGTFVNAEMVKRGYAVVMTVPPNVKYAREFLRLQRRARNTEKGMWNKN